MVKLSLEEAVETHRVCETSWFAHLGSRLTDGGDVVSLMRRTRFTPRNILGTYFCLRLSQFHGHSAAGIIRSTEKSNTSSGMEPLTFRLLA
jgi:hypothetical protein